MLLARHFKGKHGKLYVVGKLNKCRFRDFKISGFQKKIGKMTPKMTLRHSIKQMN